MENSKYSPIFFIYFRKLQQEIKSKMRERQDYQAYYYRPIQSKYYRFDREMVQRDKERAGD